MLGSGMLLTILEASAGKHQKQPQTAFDDETLAFGFTTPSAALLHDVSTYR